MSKIIVRDFPRGSETVGKTTTDLKAFYLEHSIGNTSLLATVATGYDLGSPLGNACKRLVELVDLELKMSFKTPEEKLAEEISYKLQAAGFTSLYLGRSDMEDIIKANLHLLK